MNSNVLKGYFLVVSSGLVLLAGVVLLILQWGNKTTFSLYGKNMDEANTMILMLASAVGGVVAAFLIKVLYRGARALRRGHQQQAIKQVTDQARQQK